MEYHIIFKRHSLVAYAKYCLVLAAVVLLFASNGCVSPLQVDTDRKVTVIEPIIAPPFKVDALCKEFYESGLIQDPTFLSKVDNYNDLWKYIKPKNITALIDTSSSPLPLVSMDLTLIADSSNPTRQSMRTEYVTMMRIHLDKQLADTLIHKLIFKPETGGGGSLIVTQGNSTPDSDNYGIVIIQFKGIEKINEGKISKLIMQVQAVVPSASSFPTFSFRGSVEFQW